MLHLLMPGLLTQTGTSASLLPQQAPLQQLHVLQAQPFMQATALI